MLNAPLFEAIPVGAMPIFKQRLLHRLKQLAEEAGQQRFVMPVGLILAIDEKNGGDVTAQELVARFGLLDFESRNVIDFYFLGWHRTEKGTSQGIAFDLTAFHDFRTALEGAGITKFGGNADLILVDAHYAPGDVRLNFEEAIRIDLSGGNAGSRGDPPVAHDQHSLWRSFPSSGAIGQASVV